MTIDHFIISVAEYVGWHGETIIRQNNVSDDYDAMLYFCNASICSLPISLIGISFAP